MNKQTAVSDFSKEDGKVLRTQEHCFDHIIEYPFESKYAEVNGLRIHYLDEGNRNGMPLVLLHGLPTWSYIYRKMIPMLAAKGYRVIAPDLIGYGKSDKLANKRDYTYTKNVEWIRLLLLEKLKLNNIHLIVHDWGGLIGLRLVALQPERFASVVAMNTAFPRLEGINPVFLIWRLVSSLIYVIPYSKLVRLGHASRPTNEVLAAYDAPFPDKRYKTAPRFFPSLVPIYPWQSETKTNRRLWKELCLFDKPFLTIFSDKDLFTKRVEEGFIAEIKGAKDQPHLKVKDAGHFLQEDNPGLICRHILNFYQQFNQSNENF